MKSLPDFVEMVGPYTYLVEMKGLQLLRCINMKKLSLVRQMKQLQASIWSFIVYRISDIH